MCLGSVFTGPLQCLQACQLPFKHTQLARQASVCSCLCLKWLISDNAYLSDWDIYSVCLSASFTPKARWRELKLKWSRFGKEIWNDFFFSNKCNIWCKCRGMSLVPLVQIIHLQWFDVLIGRGKHLHLKLYLMDLKTVARVWSVSVSTFAWRVGRSHLLEKPLCELENTFF